MIKQQFLFPEYYVQKIPFCDNCNVELYFTGSQLLSAPAKNVMRCPNCKKFYHISENELQGEWKWKTI